MADRTIDALEAGLKMSNLRGKAIASNVVNLETPGYHRKVVKFEDALAKALDAKGEANFDDVEPLIVEPRDTAADSTGNDVNLDVEVGEMVKNGGMYKTYLRLLNKTYRQMSLAIGVE